MPAILIIDDHPIVRKGIKQILEELPGKFIIAEAGYAAEGINKFRERNYDIVLLDINLPGRSGLDVLLDLKHIKKEVPVLIISMYPEEQYAIRAMKSGAAGYLTKESAPDELLQAVKKILKGGRYITQSLAEQIFETIDHTEPPHQSLSNRELEVMIQIAKGRSIREIADMMALSEKTISTYKSRILEKMNLRSNADIIKYAMHNRIIE
jgi:DNA-binding NarL/FixJ family response regulator